jgi:MFS family permease
MFNHLKTYFTHRQSLAVGVVFVAMGFLYGNYATLIPYLKAKFELNDAQLGLLLLSMPFGSTVTNPIATLLIQRLGMQKTTIFAMFFLGISFMVPFYLDNIYLVAIALVLVGSSEAITNIAMNTCVTAIEIHEKINIMSTSHGMFSAGLMVGSLVASLMVGLQITAPIHILIMSSIVILWALIIRKTILGIYDEPTPKNESEAKFTFPRGTLLWMIGISLCTNITEGSMADWTAVYMKEIVQTNDFFIGWGLAGYSMFMALGRFVGDKIIPVYSSNKILLYGGILAALGLIIAIFMPYTASSIIGFAMVGAGVSLGAPILYSSAARIPNMAKGAGLATMNTFGILGFLAGPVVIGFISKAINLPFAFGVIMVLALLWSYLVSKVKLY